LQAVSALIKLLAFITWDLIRNTIMRLLQPVSCLESANPVFDRDMAVPDGERIQYTCACCSYVMNIAASKSIYWMISLIHSLGYDIINFEGE